MTDTDGTPMPEYLLSTLYATDMHFDPDVRKSEITSDGIVELQVTKEPYMLHARVNIPLYGNIWVMAHNHGQGYTQVSVDFVSEAVETYIWEAERLSSGVTLSVYAQSHLDAAREYQRLSRKGPAPHYCRLKALSHAIFAAEATLFEASAERLKVNPRPEMLLGCNAWRYSGKDLYSKYFTELLNFATLPFYYYQVVPQEGVYDYSRRDELLEWCESAGLKAKGHPLWFGHGHVNPDWMYNKSYKELSAFAREYIQKTVTRYKGRIDIWIPINEPHDWPNCFNFSQTSYGLARVLL